ncbi:hypothetical protein SAMN05216503_0225 [Polaribacter sp. KT25b]|uniref:hypothetical protein n=1 Tax=Polaribacter sp. KT25b TaxID=1855336 RepID=UPI00087DE633|nr:hypothetical protein [Polaribacter sp. KT25b]SDR66983.1 hypothetical protein SAMN05216503_0225 [Polaribacter sp. KT25b]
MKFSEQITKGTLLTYQVYKYVAKNGSIFKFSYHKVGNHFEIDIHQQPSYEDRPNSSLICHYLSSSRDATRRICITVGSEPTNLQRAKQISAEWADLTCKYIATGITIDRQVQMRN